MAAKPTPPTILLVDDEELLVRAYTRLLRRRYRVQTTADGSEAIARLESGLCPDVILCDVAMPGMDGLHFLRDLRERELPFARRLLFVTGGALSPKMAAALAGSGVPVLHKPMNRTELLAAIDVMLGSDLSVTG